MNPQAQDRLYEEVSTLVPADRIPSAEEVTRMQYLRAVIKESLRWDRQWCKNMWSRFKDTTFFFCFYKISGIVPLYSYFFIIAHHQQSAWTESFEILFCRMYPVVPINARVVTDKDVTIGGYQFPKNVGLLFLAIFIFVVKPSKKIGISLNVSVF